MRALLVLPWWPDRGAEGCSIGFGDRSEPFSEPWHLHAQQRDVRIQSELVACEQVMLNRVCQELAIERRLKQLLGPEEESGGCSRSEVERRELRRDEAQYRKAGE
ncbi:hypothetical protein [Caballeronia arvi]|uniref:hypothetical protein n=1 Tax=Caballeronia arvi TaxID=1777135 RepID=UPI00117D1753|nr:hypothetical protein [Caballeronia arvi]